MEKDCNTCKFELYNADEIPCKNCGIDDREYWLPKPQTNADRIRAMSDEQLAAYWANNYDNFCQNNPECGALLDTDGEIPQENCIACALAWLRSPAEEVRQ